VTDLRDLKARVDILDVLDKIGARTEMGESYDDEVKVWCPFCEDADSHDPAASANPLKGLYFCYACGFGGTIIDLAQQHLSGQQLVAQQDVVFGAYSIPLSRAIEWLEENFPEEKEGDSDPWS
jgi:DNA primase